MDADYIAAVEETLSDLTGERGLGVKIASDVADCIKLDLLQELQDETDVARAIDIMAQNTWNDARIASAGLETFRQIQSWRAEYGGRSFMHQLLETRTPGRNVGLQIVLQTMQRNPLHANLQRNAAEILKGVLGDSNSYVPARCIDILRGGAIEIASCLVNILRNHPEDVDLQKAALGALETATTFSARKARKPRKARRAQNALIRALVPAGGIPVLFGFLTRFGREAKYVPGGDDDTVVWLLMYTDAMKSTFKVLQSLLEIDRETCQLLVDYTRNHDNWSSFLASFQDIVTSIRAVVGDEVFQRDLVQDVRGVLHQYQALRHSLIR